MSKQEVVSEKGASNAGKCQNTNDGIGADFTTPSLQTNILIGATDWHWLLDEVRLAADSTKTNECVSHSMHLKNRRGTIVSHKKVASTELECRSSGTPRHTQVREEGWREGAGHYGFRCSSIMSRFHALVQAPDNVVHGSTMINFFVGVGTVAI